MEKLLSIASFTIAGLLACFRLDAADITYPSRPIRMVVGFPAGGAADILARIVGQRLADAWGYQVVVDNRPGAGSTTGAEITAKAAPDGYTLLMISSSHAASAGLYSKLSYHPIDSFTPISLVASAPQVLLATVSLPVKSLGELISVAKSHPTTLNYGSAGNGSTTHLAGELLKSMTGIGLVHIPYKGGAPALTDLIGGQIQLLFLSLPPALPQIKAGRVKALAVTSAKRSTAVPQLPTFAEAGVAGYEATNWYGLVGPAGMPKPIVAKLAAQNAKEVRSVDAVDTITKLGAEPEGSSPTAFESYMRAEIAKWSKVIKDARIQAN